jgi:predicted Rossmann fold nucleotide-binding protein DprA/Smf involved in DNA uptake
LTRSVLHAYAGRNFDGLDQYLGWLALAVTPGLGARMAGKLLRAMGSPEAIFNASLIELESHRLPVAVTQAIHTRQPMSAAAEKLAQAQAAGIRLLTWDEPQYPSACVRFTTPRPSCMSLETFNFLIAT